MVTVKYFGMLNMQTAKTVVRHILTSHSFGYKVHAIKSGSPFMKMLYFPVLANFKSLITKLSFFPVYSVVVHLQSNYLR